MPGPWSRIFSQRSHFPAKFEKLLELLVVPLDAAYEGFLLRFARRKLDSFHLEIEPDISLTSFVHLGVICCVCSLNSVSFQTYLATFVIIPGQWRFVFTGKRSVSFVVNVPRSNSSVKELTTSGLSKPMLFNSCMHCCSVSFTTWMNGTWKSPNH